MDILGVGAAELLLIGLLILIVAGPKRSVEWARIAGEYVYKLRQMWQKMMQDLRSEMGEDADVFVRTAEEIQRTTSSVRNATSPRNVVGKALQASETLAAQKQRTNPQPDAPKQENGVAEASRYAAWTKPTVNPTKPESNNSEDASS